MNYIDIVRYGVRLRRLGFKVFSEYGRFRLQHKGKEIGCIRWFPDGKPDVTAIQDESVAKLLQVTM